MSKETNIECGRCGYKGKGEYSPKWCGIICPQCREEGRTPLVFPDLAGD